LITGCGTPGGAPETTSDRDRFEAGKCFGLGEKISYLAEQSKQSGSSVWQHRFTFANSFDSAPATRYAGQIAYAVVSFDPLARKLTIRFFSSDGDLIHEGFIVESAIRQCTDDHAEIFFLRSTAADGARVSDRVTVKISRINNAAWVTTEIDRTQYILFVPFKRMISYVAEFRLHGGGH
jgi:hypothetical protein